MFMLLVVFSGFILALCMPFISKILNGNRSAWISLFPFSLFCYFFSHLPEISAGNSLKTHWDWVPSLGVGFDFHLDGLALLFTLLITGIGTLVFLYTSSYLKGHVYLDRFYGFLSLFMGSMLGVVLSDNLITLFVFWELTSISSFFLIGFNNDSEASRKSALTALTITGIGGLFLLAGLVTIGVLTGDYQLSNLAALRLDIQGSEWYTLILILIFLGTFTKSAQFPFHFWLPGAMKAPTPVSTYLHSATMVKAGIYLLARFTPILGGNPTWNTTLIVVGAITMSYAAIHALFRLDLKGILAYSTISALGMLVFLIGIGTEQALLAAGVFILVHALYKATLFLVTGIVDHETGSRDISRLSGLNKVMKPVALAALFAALSNAGIPITFGFIGKDLIYEATLHAGEWAGILTTVAFITNVALLVAGFLAGIKPFWNKLPAEYEKVHLPQPSMWVPPLILGGLGLLFGIFPGLTAPLMEPVFLSLTLVDPTFSLKVWHGFNTVLFLSLGTLAMGMLAYFLLKPSERLENGVSRFERVSPQHLLVGFANLFYRFSEKWTGILQNGYLRNYLITILGFLTLVLGYRLFFGVDIQVDTSALTEVSIPEVAVVIIMATAIIFTVFTSSRLTAVASLGVVGYCFCLIFLFYSAPDLAMTQFSIDTLTVILFVLVLYNLPKYVQLSRPKDRIRDGALALVFGALISVLTLEILNEPVENDISAYYAEKAYTLAKGKNVVNVILVDFRGIDTMVEITVLAIAAMGVFSLMKLRAKPIEKD